MRMEYKYYSNKSVQELVIFLWITWISYLQKCLLRYILHNLEAYLS